MSNYFLSQYISYGSRVSEQVNTLGEVSTWAFGQKNIHIRDFQKYIEKVGHIPKTIRIVSCTFPDNFGFINQNNNKLYISYNINALPYTITIPDKFQRNNTTQELEDAINAVMPTPFIVTWAGSNQRVIIRETTGQQWYLKSQPDSGVVDSSAYATLGILINLVRPAVLNGANYEIITDYATSYFTSVYENVRFPMSVDICSDLIRGLDRGIISNPMNVVSSTNVYPFKKMTRLATVIRDGTGTFTNFNTTSFLIDMPFNTDRIADYFNFILIDEFDRIIEPLGEWAILVEFGFENREDSRTTLTKNVR